ncbi:MAG: sn-glycerol-3-phosphate ABC transporter ATP-binding protein UgpC [Actinomycetota bacterium]
MSYVSLHNLTKIYPGNADPSVSDLSLDIEEGEFVVFVGPSGCGKSTALRMVAGLESITAGQLYIAGDNMTDVSPQDRDIAMVFQNYALYPHMTVGKNMAYPLKIAGVPKDEIERRVKETAGVLQLEEYLDRKPGNLSGGQRQRVAMGRALIRSPKVFLMDEPLSNLDAKLRVYMRTEIARIQQELGITTIYVTHDQVEAMTMGDRVVVLKDGELQQADAPANLYTAPGNMFVAGFIGSPAMNLFEGVVTEVEGALAVSIGPNSLDIPSSVVERHSELRNRVGDTIAVGIRPDDMYDAALNPQYPTRLRGTPLLLESLGSEIVTHLDLGVRPMDSTDPDVEELGDADGGAVVARFSPHSTVAKGQPIEISVDSQRLHFFDIASGNRI